MNRTTSSPTRPLLDRTRLPVPPPVAEPTVYWRSLSEIARAARCLAGLPGAWPGYPVSLLPVSRR
jgi:hypothetical protein